MDRGLMWVSTTGERPLPDVPLAAMFDATLGKPIFRVGDNPVRRVDINGRPV